MLYLPDYISGFTIISVLPFLLHKNAYFVLLVQGDLILVLPGWGRTDKAARASWLFQKINIDIKVKDSL